LGKGIPLPLSPCYFKIMIKIILLNFHASKSYSKIPVYYCTDNFKTMVLRSREHDFHAGIYEKSSTGSLNIYIYVCVCVCVREREREYE
jgi:hypothetical protein